MAWDEDLIVDRILVLNSLTVLLAIFMVLALVCLALSRYLRRMSGLPGGDVTYSDLPEKAGETLISRKYGLRGKPDYLIKTQGDGLVPVEVKSSPAPRNGQPYQSHLMQLAVYFILIEDVLKCQPRYGLIRYRDRTIQISNSAQLREELFEIVEQMRYSHSLLTVQRSHHQRRRCAGCSMAYTCDERLE
jgi:CRISPR-associated exonuclease Cas4